MYHFSPEQDLQEAGNVVIIMSEDMRIIKLLTRNYLYVFDIEMRAIEIGEMPEFELINFDFELTKKALLKKINSPETYAILESERKINPRYKKYLERLFDN